jgi:predicted nucleic acid-binding protein
MGKNRIMIDSCILIEYFRKTDKSKSTLIKLVSSGFELATSVLIKYERYSGAASYQLEFWQSILRDVLILPIEECCVDEAVSINAKLKRDRKQIEVMDLLIAATAVANKMPLATLNKRHFERITSLELI